MTTVITFSLLLCVLLATNDANNRNSFRYEGWGWTPQFKGLHPELPGLKKFVYLSQIHKCTICQHIYMTIWLYTRITKECIVKLSNATFNLLPLHLSEKNQIRSYKVKDERSLDDPNDDYLYEFNVCGPVGAVPTGCKQAQMMVNTWDHKPRQYCEDNRIAYNVTEDGSSDLFHNGKAYCNVSTGMSTVGDTPGTNNIIQIRFK